jgi:hypothetical protein
MQVVVSAAATLAVWAAAAPADQKTETVDGVVRAVMESDPLQLTVGVKAGDKEEKYAVLLTDRTVVTRDGKPAKPADLKPDQVVKVTGTPTGAKGITATKIEIGKPKP